MPKPTPETELAAGLASLGMDPAEAAAYATDSTARILALRRAAAPAASEAYQAKAFVAHTTFGPFEASGTLCGNIDFIGPFDGCYPITPDEALAISVMLQQARADVLNNSDPLGDPRIVNRSPTPLLLSGGDEGLRTSGAALGDESAQLSLLRDALKPFAELDDGTETGLCEVVLFESANLRRASIALQLTAALAAEPAA